MPNRRPSQKPSVVILGAGKIGQALAHFLQQTSSAPPIHFWDKEPGKVPEQLPLDQILPAASYVFYCIPSWALKGALDETASFISKNATILCVSKGIEPTTQKTIDDLLSDYFSSKNIALILGPMLADEILRGLPGYATVATKEPKTFRLIETLFKKSDLQLTYHPSLKEAAFASVLKNVYSLAMGLADGMEWGNNQKGALATLAIMEMERLFQVMRYRPVVLRTPAGLPDLLATAFSPTSRNRILGEEIVRSGICSFQSEGYIALPSLIEHLHKKTQPFPILHALRRVLLQGKHKEIQKIFGDLLRFAPLKK